mgnify:CR=1 FL=1
MVFLHIAICKGVFSLCVDPINNDKPFKSYQISDFPFFTSLVMMIHKALRNQRIGGSQYNWEK